MEKNASWKNTWSQARLSSSPGRGHCAVFSCAVFFTSFTLHPVRDPHTFSASHIQNAFRVHLGIYLPDYFLCFHCILTWLRHRVYFELVLDSSSTRYESARNISIYWSVTSCLPVLSICGCSTQANLLSRFFMAGSSWVPSALTNYYPTTRPPLRYTLLSLRVSRCVFLCPA